MPAPRKRPEKRLRAAWSTGALLGPSSTALASSGALIATLEAYHHLRALLNRAGDASSTRFLLLVGLLSLVDCVSSSILLSTICERQLRHPAKAPSQLPPQLPPGSAHRRWWLRRVNDCRVGALPHNITISPACRFVCCATVQPRRCSTPCSTDDTNLRVHMRAATLARGSPTRVPRCHCTPAGATQQAAL